MTRSQVISNLITKYDKVVTGQDKSAIELAVFKIAICQLVDAVFTVSGQNYGANTRVALSTTQQTCTPVTVFTGISLSIEVNA